MKRPMKCAALDFSERPEVPADLLGALTRGDAQTLGRLMHNDLAPAAIKSRPVLGRVLEYGIDSGALGAVISGSGPTCGFLVHDESSAIDLVVDLKASGLVDDVTSNSWASSWRASYLDIKIIS